MTDRIKLLRKTLKFTQQEFGEKIGVKQTTVATYESGRNEPTESVIQLIVREFGVSDAWLRTGEGEMFQKSSLSNEVAFFAGKLSSMPEGSIEQRFVAALSKLSHDDWERVLKFAQEVVGNQDETKEED